MMSRIDTRHRKISTGRHFQNGRHNTVQIQNCPISTTFHIWVDYDVSNYSRRWKSSSGRHAIFKMAATIPHKFNIVRFQCPELIPDIDKFLPVSIFKMAATIPQKNQHCSISKVAFNLFFKPIVSGRFGRLHNC